MYKIIGADKKEYGPVTAAQMHQWISEGRANSQTLVQAVGATDWKPLSAFPEFADALRINLEPIAPAFAPSSAAVEAELSTTDYELDLGDYIPAGWDVVKNNFGILFGGVVIYYLINMCIGAAGKVPVLGFVVQLGSLVVAGPLMGGLFYLFLKTVRGEPSDIGMIFSGFSRAFLQLFLVYIVMGILMLLCSLPAIIAIGIEFADFFKHFQADALADQPFAHFNPSGSQIEIAIAAMLICAIPVLYLGICWQYAIILIADRQIDFWTALQTSRRRVSMHWWQNFGLVILIGLLNIAGLIACCVGLLVTIPIGFATLMIAYETIFFGKSPKRN